jgi:hypothetical protein
MLPIRRDISHGIIQLKRGMFEEKDFPTNLSMYCRFYYNLGLRILWSQLDL